MTHTDRLQFLRIRNLPYIFALFIHAQIHTKKTEGKKKPRFHRHLIIFTGRHDPYPTQETDGARKGGPARPTVSLTGRARASRAAW
jgi:hypothetical protein